MISYPKASRVDQIAGWIAQRLGPELTAFGAGPGKASLALDGTILTLRARWWGVQGTLRCERAIPMDSLARLWERHRFWGPSWLRERPGLVWRTRALAEVFKPERPCRWEFDQAMGLDRFLHRF